jgi:hypothetical protein
VVKKVNSSVSSTISWAKVESWVLIAGR